MNYNKLILGGRLVSDIEITKLRADTSGEIIIGKSAIAIDSFVSKDDDGNVKTEPIFVDFTVFGRRALAMARLFSKGYGILLEGQIRISQYKNKDGSEKRKTYMLVEKFDFVDKHNYSETETEQNQTDDSVPF